MHLALLGAPALGSELGLEEEFCLIVSPVAVIIWGSGEGAI